jgi:transcriptional regulator with XRE-family HTH domain
MPRRRKHITAGDEPLIGKRIAILRSRHGLTQVALAAKLGMSQPLLSRYERGELRLHGGLIAELAKALNVPSDGLERFLVGTGRRGPTSGESWRTPDAGRDPRRDRLTSDRDLTIADLSSSRPHRIARRSAAGKEERDAEPRHHDSHCR